MRLYKHDNIRYLIIDILDLQTLYIPIANQPQARPTLQIIRSSLPWPRIV